MSATEPAVPGSGTGTAPGGTVRYRVPHAARVLGISERAVRKRIDAGTLFAVRDGRAWVVYLEEAVGGTDTAAAAEPAVPAEPVPEPAAAPGGTVDLAPLADLIADLTRQNAQPTEAAAVWQVRAIQAEERLKQLTAGGDALNKSGQIAGEAIATDSTPDAPETGAPQRPVQRAWWRFWGR
jgi:hypothetical protein